MTGENQKRRAAAQKAVETKRHKAQQEVLDYLNSLTMRPIPPRKGLETRVRNFISMRYGDFPAVISEKAICSFIRHNYTNYETILTAIRGKVGVRALYEDIKVYLCCAIIRHYSLQIDPYTAAWGEPSADFDGDIEALQARILATLTRGEE